MVTTGQSSTTTPEARRTTQPVIAPVTHDPLVKEHFAPSFTLSKGPVTPDTATEDAPVILGQFVRTEQPDVLAEAPVWNESAVTLPALPTEVTPSEPSPQTSATIIGSPLSHPSIVPPESAPTSPTTAANSQTTPAPVIEPPATAAEATPPTPKLPPDLITLLRDWSSDEVTELPSPDTTAPRQDTVTITVHNDADLSEALTKLSAGGGGHILLTNSGHGYTLNAQDTGHDRAKITLTSADANDPAVVTSVTLNQTRNLTFDGLHFDATNPNVSKIVTIQNSTDIAITNARFTGTASGFASTPEEATGPGALLIRESTNIRVEGTEFAHMTHGIGVIDSHGTVIRNNSFHHQAFDGIQLTGVVDTIVENNVMRDFYFSTQTLNHSDFIQVFSATFNTLLTENLTIRGNLLLSPGDYGSQSIFIRNEMADWNGSANYRNIEVSDNVILNGHLHGIAISGTDGVRVAGNTVLWNPQAMIYDRAGAEGGNLMPVIRLWDVTGAVVTDNITGGVLADGADQCGNVIVNYDNSLSPDHISRNMVNATGADPLRDARDLRLLPDSTWLGKGASLSQPQDDALAVIRHSPSPDTPGAVIFDGTFSTGIPDDALYHWQFSDGAEGIGPTVTRQFDVGTEQSATLTITSPDGTAQVTRAVTVDPDTLFTLNFSGEPPPNGVELQGEVGDNTFLLTGTSKVVIDNDAVFGQQSFTLALSLQLDPDGKGGAFLDMHTQLRGVVNDDRSVTVWVQTDVGRVSVTTEPGVIGDEWHRLAISFEGGQNGSLGLYADGAEAGRVDVSAPMVTTGTYPLVLGNTWHDSLIGRVADLTLQDRAHGADWAAADARGQSATQPDAPTLIQGTMAGDILSGFGLGAVMTGGAGADVFVIGTISDTPDRVTDFDAQDDMIALDAGQLGIQSTTQVFTHANTLWHDPDGPGAASPQPLVHFAPGSEVPRTDDIFLF